MARSLAFVAVDYASSRPLGHPDAIRDMTEEETEMAFKAADQRHREANKDKPQFGNARLLGVDLVAHVAATSADGPWPFIYSSLCQCPGTLPPIERVGMVHYCPGGIAHFYKDRETVARYLITKTARPP